MIKKRLLLQLSLVCSAILIVINYVGTDSVCGGEQYTSCMQTVHSILLLFLPIFPLLLFLLITYWMRNSVYETWFKFARWAIPLSMLAILAAPEYPADWVYPVDKGDVALLACGLFSLVSILIIGFKYFRTTN